MPSDRFTDRPFHDKSTRTMYVVPYIHFEKSGGGCQIHLPRRKLFMRRGLLIYIGRSEQLLWILF